MGFTTLLLPYSILNTNQNGGGLGMRLVFSTSFYTTSLRQKQCCPINHAMVFHSLVSKTDLVAFLGDIAGILTNITKQQTIDSKTRYTFACATIVCKSTMTSHRPSGEYKLYGKSSPDNKHARSCTMSDSTQRLSVVLIT